MPDTRCIDMNCPSLVVFETETPILHNQDSTKQVKLLGRTVLYKHYIVNASSIYFFQSIFGFV